MEAQVHAGAPDVQTGGDQKPTEVSSQETSAPAATEPSSVPPEKGKEGAAVSAPKGEEEEKTFPFSNHPAWQRMLRKNARSEKLVRDQTKTIHDLGEQLKTFMAKQSGEEYTPTALPEDMDLEAAFDNELEDLSAKEKLSSHDEEEIASIANKYAYEVDGKRIPLPAAISYQILKDLRSAKVVPSAPETPPAPKKDEKPSVQPLKKETMVIPRRSIDQIVAAAKQRLG